MDTNKLDDMIEKARENFNIELTKTTGSNLTKLCYAEGYLDALLEVKKCTETTSTVNKQNTRL